MRSASTHIIRAKWVAPMDRPLIANGAVAFSGGKIVAVGEFDSLRHDISFDTLHDAGEVVLLPGLINAHTHLELSMCEAGDSPISFVDWILSLRDRMGPQPDFALAAFHGAEESIAFGVTCVGDISQQSHLTRGVLPESPLRIVSFGEALGIGAGRGKFQDLLKRALACEESEFLRVGLSPHASYSVDERDFRDAVRLANETGIQISTHLAEQFAEREFLRSRTGPFRELLETIGAWDDDVRTYEGSPMEFARSVGLLSNRALLAHVNDCDDADLKLLSNGNASVVWCPRTHAYFGHEPHRWRDMLERGVNVCVGTDSRASSPDLNVVDDLRLIRRQHSDVPADLLWSMVTTRAAKALWMEDSLGALEAGAWADVVAFPVKTSDPLEEILQSSIVPSTVWVAGIQVPKSGG